jgi:hypothetical protein
MSFLQQEPARGVNQSVNTMTGTANIRYSIPSTPPAPCKPGLLVWFSSWQGAGLVQKAALSLGEDLGVAEACNVQAAQG